MLIPNYHTHCLNILLVYWRSLQQQTNHHTPDKDCTMRVGFSFLITTNIELDSEMNATWAIPHTIFVCVFFLCNCRVQAEPGLLVYSFMYIIVKGYLKLAQRLYCLFSKIWVVTQLFQAMDDTRILQPSPLAVMFWHWFILWLVSLILSYIIFNKGYLFV